MSTNNEDFTMMKDILMKYIAEYDKRLGYLGANWNNEIYERYENNLSLSFRVYFDYDYCTDIYIDENTWNMSNYLDIVVEQALPKAYEFVDDGYIATIEPESFEMTF